MPAIRTEVMETEPKQKTPSDLASSESLYLGSRKQNYFRSRDNHFRFEENCKYCCLNLQVNNLKASERQKVLPVTCDVEYSLPVEPGVIFRWSADVP